MTAQQILNGGPFHRMFVVSSNPEHNPLPQRLVLSVERIRHLEPLINVTVKGKFPPILPMAEHKILVPINCASEVELFCP